MHMSLKKIIWIIIAIFFISNTPIVFAKINTVVGEINFQDSMLVGSRVIFIDSESKEVVVDQAVDSAGNYIARIPDGTYDIGVIATPDSDPQIFKSDQRIDSDSVLDIDGWSYQNYLDKIGIRRYFKNNILYFMLISAGVVLVTRIGLLIWKKK